MFTRPLFGVDLETQHLLLNELADLIERGIIVPRVTQTFPNMSFIGEAHKIQQSGKAIGKTVLTLAF
jgi:NADPH2:quinone reductase